MLGADEIAANVNKLQDQFQKIDSRMLEMVPSKSPMKEIKYINNIDFYSKLNTVSFLRDVGKHFRVGTMLSRDSVKSRMNSS